jgi:hypothetical protein
MSGNRKVLNHREILLEYFTKGKHLLAIMTRLPEVSQKIHANLDEPILLSPASHAASPDPTYSNDSIH